MANRNPVYSKKLGKELDQLYTSNQIDEFNWYVDSEDDLYYRFHFIDHEKVERKLVLNKQTNEITLYSVKGES